MYRTPKKTPQTRQTAESERSPPKIPLKPTWTPLEGKSTTITKGKRHNPTPSPMNITTHTNRTTEVTIVYRKGVENLNKFLNLRKDVKAEVKKALDRLYELAKMAPVVRSLQKELGETQKTDDTQAQTKAKEPEYCNREKNRDEDHIMQKINENNILLLDNNKKMDELKTLIEDQKQNLERATYASMEASRQTTKPIQDRESLHSVVISSKNEQDTGEEVLERVRKAVDAKEGWVTVEKVRKAKDRKIIMGCRTKEERQKVKDRLEKAGVHLVIEEVKNKDPLLIIKDVLSVHSDDDVLKALRNQNRNIFQGLKKQEDKMTIKYRKKARSPHTCHIVLSVSPVIWKRATEMEKLRVDLQHVHVEDQSPLVQCSKCLGYGHGKRFCREPQDLCSHCGGPHLRIACPELIAGETPKCINCKRAKLDNYVHNAFSRECSIRRKWDSIARASISYC